MPPFLNAIIDWLRAGYPDGVPESDYIPLLALLRRRLSDAEVHQIAAELADSVVSSDPQAIASGGDLPADKADIQVHLRTPDGYGPDGYDRPGRDRWGFDPAAPADRSPRFPGDSQLDRQHSRGSRSRMNGVGEWKMEVGYRESALPHGFQLARPRRFTARTAFSPTGGADPRTRRRSATTSSGNCGGSSGSSQTIAAMSATVASSV